MYECEPAPLGWWAGAFFVFVAVFGGLLLPTVLIGVISIAFDDATKQINEEKKEKWGFDFSKGEPIEGSSNVEWIKIKDDVKSAPLEAEEKTETLKFNTKS